MHNTQVQEFAQALSNGAKLVVVDPRHSVAAGKADWYLPIKPGTDIALLLAWMNVIIREGLYDREYVENYTTGFERLKEHVKPYTPEKVWIITGVKPELILRTAREMGRQKPAVLIHPGRHVTWYGDDTQRSRAIAILNALLGSWGRKGGFFYPGELEVPSPKTPPTPNRPAPAPTCSSRSTRWLTMSSPPVCATRPSPLPRLNASSRGGSSMAPT